MNWKFTLILIAIVVAFYFFFDFYEVKQSGTSDPNADHVFAFDRNQIDGLTITDHDRKIELVRNKDNRWSIKSPVIDRAEQSLIDQVMTNLEILRKDDTIPGKDVSKSKLTDYGLQSPHERLLITANGGHTTEADFGNETVLDGKTYLQVAGTSDVLVVSDELKKLLGKDVNAWREHRLTDLAATDVNKLILKNASGEIEIQKEGEHWKLIKPLAARADDAKVNDTVSQITNLQISSFVADDKADAASYGLAEPKGTITLFTPNDSKGTELLVGNSPPEPKSTPAASPAPATPTAEEKIPMTVYARLPARQSIYTIPTTINDVLALKPFDLRDHSLVRVNTDVVDRIHYLATNGQAFTLSRKDKSWTILDGPAANQPADGTVVASLLTILTGANVKDFVADSASDLAKYGLDKPSLQVKLSSFATENTAESNAGEKPLSTVSFGKTDDQVIYARVEDEPFVVSIPKALVDELPMEAVDWQSPSIFQAEPSKVNTLEVAVRERLNLTLTRPDKGNWTVTGKTEGILNAAKTESVVNTLARLHAVRWAGPIKPDDGLDKPSATFKFGSTTDPKLGGRLTLGSSDPQGETFAQVGGKPGVFLVARPDVEVLTAELLPGTSPTPTLAPVPTSTPTLTATPSTPPPGPIATPSLIIPPLPTPLPTPTPAPTPLPTAVPTPLLVPTPLPTSTPVSTATAAALETPVPKAMPTLAAPAPTPIPTPTPVTPEPTPAPIPVPTATALPASNAAATAAPVPSPTPETPAVSTPADIPSPNSTPTS